MLIFFFLKAFFAALDRKKPGQAIPEPLFAFLSLSAQKTRKSNLTF